MLSSSQCFAVPASAIPPLSLESPEKLRYELERFLPLDAEELVVASLDGVSFKKSPLILATSKSTLEDEIARLANPDQWLTCVSPEPLIVIQQWLLQNPGCKPSVVCMKSVSDASLKGDSPGRTNCWDVVFLSTGKPTSWEWVASSGLHQVVALAPERNVIQLVDVFDSQNNHPKEYLMSGDIDSVQRPEALSNCEIVAIDYQKLKATALEQLRLRKTKPWFDFKRHTNLGGTAKHPLSRSTLFGFFCVNLVLWGCVIALVEKTINLNHQIESTLQAQEEAFLAEFPRQTVPVDIAGRLKSELRKLETSQSQLATVPEIPSVIPTLVALINALPAEAVFRIDQLIINPQRESTLSGAVRNLSDFDAIRNSLSENQFQYSPPGTTQLIEGYSIRIEKLRLVTPEPTKQEVSSARSNSTNGPLP
ncbi:MAG: hypothetical protein MUC83_00440 [Pirellula sp.]|nr:hypothetical protein [Pirellula sp.]